MPHTCYGFEPEITEFPLFHQHDSILPEFKMCNSRRRCTLLLVRPWHHALYREAIPLLMVRRIRTRRQMNCLLARPTECILVVR